MYADRLVIGEDSVKFLYGFLEGVHTFTIAHDDNVSYEEKAINDRQDALIVGKDIYEVWPYDHMVTVNNETMSFKDRREIFEYFRENYKTSGR